MSLFPDLTPLTNEIKVFNSQLQALNAHQISTHQLLTAILTEIQSIKKANKTYAQLK
jgi:hypothetical protein